MKIMDTGAVTINMVTTTKIMIMIERATVIKSTAIKDMGMGMDMMTAITRLCMAGTRAIAETCRPDSQKRIDCRLAWNGNWNFGARCHPV
jgi:hypothetical protein